MKIREKGKRLTAILIRKKKTGDAGKPKRKAAEDAEAEAESGNPGDPEAVEVAGLSKPQRKRRPK